MAREYRGGYYLMNHESFGAMMVSEQLRKPLSVVAGLIRIQAKVNTQQSSSGGSNDHDGVHLADAYDTHKGPLVDVPGPAGEGGLRITHRVFNPLRYAARREFGAGGHERGQGTRDLRRAGAMFGDLAGGPG